MGWDEALRPTSHIPVVEGAHMQIRGAVLEEIGRQRPYASSRPLTISDLELDPPGAGEILVRMEASGVCHSDLSVVNGHRVRPVPMLLGHEAAGIVEELGEGVDDVEVGQRVVMTFLPRCGECDACKTDGRLPCTPGTEANNAGVLLGGGVRLHRDGDEVFHHLGVSGFATHAVVNRKSVVPVGSDVPAAVAAVLGCAVLTGGGALLNAAAPEEGDSIAIVGLGGVGVACLLTAVASGVQEIIAVDMSEEKRELALSYGAHAAYSPEEMAERAIKTTHAVECAGHPAAFMTAFNATAPGGRTVTAGLPSPEQTAEISPLTITGEARTIIGSYLGTSVPARDIPRYEQMWREGRLPVEKLVSATMRLDDINEAMDQLADGRAVRQIIEY